MIIDKSFTVKLSKEELNQAIIEFVKSKTIINRESKFKVKIYSNGELHENITDASVSIEEPEIPKVSNLRSTNYDNFDH